MYVYDPEPELEPEPEPEPELYSDKMSVPEPEPEPSSNFSVPQPWCPAKTEVVKKHCQPLVLVQTVALGIISVV